MNLLLDSLSGRYSCFTIGSLLEALRLAASRQTVDVRLHVLVRNYALKTCGPI